MSPFDLTNRGALVTGGNGGIGLGIARGLAKAGASIAIAARNEVEAWPHSSDAGPRERARSKRLDCSPPARSDSVDAMPREFVVIE
ncbi:MAG TPA: SDR family NAD(P)-dependent oxidoreductase [Burkholderiaceae bacterium]|nr:SDR family NAD(P)-dependent oxidoreductase [Burkholderiaceae bacterium]